MGSHLTLLVGQAGSGKTEWVLDQYRLALKKDRRRRFVGGALWLTPTRYARQVIVKKLMSNEESVQVGLQLLTFDGFAGTILAAAGHPASPISSVMKRLLLRRIVAELYAAGALSRFSAVIHTSGFLDVVSALISELKREEIWPGDFLAACAQRGGERAERDRDLGRVYEQYQRCLTEHDWYDNEGRFWLARTALAAGIRGPFGAVEFLVVDGFADFTRTQHQILGHLMGWIPQTLVTLPLDDVATRGDLFAKPIQARIHLRESLPKESVFQQETLVSDHSRWKAGHARLVQHLFENPRSIQQTNNAAGIELIAATGPVGEREAVARRVKRLLQSGTSPAEIVIGLRFHSEDPLAWRDFLKEAGIPIWCEANPALTASPVVKFLFLLLQMELNDWSFLRLHAVLDSNLFQPPWIEYHRHAVRAVAGTLRELKLHAEREIILRVVSRVAQGALNTRNCSEKPPGETMLLDRSETSVADLACVAEPLLVRLSQATEQLRRRHTLADWVNVLAVIGADIGWGKSGSTGGTSTLEPVDSDDWDLLQRIVRTAAEVDRKFDEGRAERTIPRLDLHEFTAELRDLLSGETIPSAFDPNGCVRILDVEQVRHLNVPHLFVGGLSESSFPKNRADDCLFSDVERRDLSHRGLALQHRERHQQEEMFLFYTLVTKARTSLTLSYPAINRQGQAVFPSPYVSAIRALFTEDALKVAHEGHLDPVPSMDHAMTKSDLRLVAITEARANRPGLFAHLLTDAEWEPVGRNVLAAVEVNAHRFCTRGFTNYEGRLRVPQNLQALRQRFGASHQFSATELESYAKCPFRYWLENVLKIDPLPDPEEGTDYQRRGMLIHDVLATLLTEGMDVNEADMAARFRRLVEDRMAMRPHENRLQRALIRIEAEMLGLVGDAFAMRQVEYGQKLNDVWGGSESSLPPEITFGSLPDVDSQAADAIHPPILFGRDEHAVRVRGRIDRIDVGVVDGRPVFNVIDYKTGDPPTSNEAELRSGRAIQLALYTSAVQRMGVAGLDATPFQMAYWSLKGLGLKPGYPSKKGFVAIDVAVVNSMQQILDDLIPKLAESLRSGKFLVENSNKDCTGQCPFHTTCRVNQIRSVSESLQKIGDILR